MKGAATGMLVILGVLALLGCSSTSTVGVDGGSEDAQPDKAIPSSAIISVTVGDYHTCVAREDGTAWCWGGNHYSQLDGKSDHRCPAEGDCSTTPVRVANLDDAASVAALDTTSCALTASGGVVCWGTDFDGTLGGTPSSLMPAKIEIGGLDSIESIDAGQWHFCTLDSSGAVRCWGNNGDGQLGGAKVADAPVAVGGLPTALSVTAGGAHSCALVHGGRVWCWGGNRSGQLGHSSVGSIHVEAAEVAGLSDVAQISAGTHHTCAVKTDGSVLCWGGNVLGELGDGTHTDRDTPTAVAGIEAGVAEVSTGSYHTCALAKDDSVWCWGANDWGVLGDLADHGCTVTEDGFKHKCATKPVRVSGLPPIVGISVGFAHNCALASDGSLWCWGANGSGQLGDGATANVTFKPVRVKGL